MVKRMWVPLLVAMVLIFTFALALTAQETGDVKFSGEVVKMEPKRMIVKSGDGTEHIIKAKPNSLKGIEIGDTLEVDRTKKVITILKKAKAPALAPAEAATGAETKH